MLLKEIPALPFELDSAAAAAWLERLPVGNIRESSRLLFPVMQALNVYPMALRLRFDLLEQCRPTVLGVTRELLPYFIGQSFPLEEKARKIASLCGRFHFEAAQGYRELIVAESFQEVFSPDERLHILERALEHLAQTLLRSAQMYEMPPSAAWSSVEALYRHADANGMLGPEKSPEYRDSPSVCNLLRRIVLFRLAAPNRLEQVEIQRLFDLLTAHAVSVDTETGAADRAVFCYDPGNIRAFMPLPPTAMTSPRPDLRLFPIARLFSGLRAEFRAAGRGDRDPLLLVLPRLGERLPCQDQPAGRQAVPVVGFDAVLAALRHIELRRNKTEEKTGWPEVERLELAPLGEPLGAAMQASKSGRVFAGSGDAVADPFPQEKRTIEVRVSDLPGFCLLDSGRRPLRSGEPVGLNTDDRWMQIGVVRSGQIREGRFWHSLELLGTKPCWVRVRAEHEEVTFLNGILLEEGENRGETGLLVPPVKWRNGSRLVVERAGVRRVLRIARLLEAATGFMHFVLMHAGEAPGS